jgi:mono/diheme cytochrome c family protein
MKATYWLLGLLAAGGALAAQESAEHPSYSRDIRPLFERHCQACHQPASKMGAFDLTRFDRLMAGGAKGAVIQPGDPAASRLVGYLTGDTQPRMPMGGDPLSAEQIDLVRAWIAGGARDDTPDELKAGGDSGEPPVYTLPPVIHAIAYSPDGQHLAVAGYREVLLHKADGSGIQARLVGLSEHIQSLVFTRDGKTLIAAGGTPARFGELQIWDVASGKLTRSVMTCEDTVFGASVSPDGSKIAFGCPDQSTRIVETATGNTLQKSSYHENWVLGTAFGVDGKRIVSIGRDRAAKLADAATGAFLENVNLLRGELIAIARHPTRDTVAIGGEDRVPYYYLLDRPRKMKIADDTTLIREFQRQNGEIFALAFSADGRRLAVGGASNEVPVYDVETGERVATCRGHEAGIYTVAFHPAGKQLATAGFDGQVRLYNAATGELERAFVPVPIEPKGKLMTAK